MMNKSNGLGDYEGLISATYSACLSQILNHYSFDENNIIHIMILEERINDLIGDICHITIHDIDEDYNAHIIMEKGEMIK